jgi:hypothetical protein
MHNRARLLMAKHCHCRRVHIWVGFIIFLNTLFVFFCTGGQERKHTGGPLAHIMIAGQTAG